jgi:succinyl-CoA synthetase beta subunit
MKLLEYEAKTLLRASGIAVPTGALIQTPEDSCTVPCVLKSQVPTGGRGKAGGVIIVENEADARAAIPRLFQLNIKGFLPKVLLAEEKLTIERELYLSLLVDRTSAGLKLLAHTRGGIEVEENTDFESWPVDYTEPNYDALGQSLADYYELADQTFALQDLVEHLITCLKQNDALMIEINPLILTADNKLIAGDCKMTLDDAAAFRHPDWQFEDTPKDANFVELNREGTIATIANGAGLAMATVDAVARSGLTPANFLDIGGGASTESVLRAFRRILEFSHVQAIVINIFAGITR